MKLLEEFSIHKHIYDKGYRFDPQDEIFFTDNTKNFVFPNPEDQPYPDHIVTGSSNYSEWKIQKINPKEYLTQRLNELGLKEKDITVDLFDKDGQKFQSPIFQHNKFGDIEIIKYSLRRKTYTYEVKTTSVGTKWEYRVRKRLNPIYAVFCDGKYDGSEDINAPFWHPTLCDAFENGIEVPTLIITEGPFKAWKASHHGIPTVALNSINHFKDKDTGELHTEILEFISKCQVKNVVILWDGDCRNISEKQVKNKSDLSDRPYSFFNYARWIRNSIYKVNSPRKLSVFHATIKTNDIEGNPKGIDDLLILKDIPATDVKIDFDRVGKIPGYYIAWINITTDGGLKDLRSYYFLDSVYKFYQHHSELINGKNFLFQRNTYRVEKGIPIIEVSADLKEYKLIGTDFYREMECTVPVGKSGETILEKRLIGWKSDIIKLNHGKDCLSKIEKFKGFTNIPSHIDYQQVINEEWNLYVDVKHEKSEGDFPTIRKLLKHVFDEHYDNEMILDFITVLYKFPMQKLPIICLLSEEQGTGKSTFLFLLKLIFKQNMAVISNNEITGEFNAHWTSKLIVACEETIFDKKEAYEKLKQYSTQKTLTRNEKNKSQTEIPCMLHFVLCSNHENDFMRISKYDRRLWVRKVHPFKKKEENADITFDDRLEQEIPHFVHFIENREIKYKERGELFFHQTDFQTEAFYNLVDHSEPGIVKDIKEALTDNFLKYGGTEIELTPDDFIKYFQIKGEKNYIKKMLLTYFKAQRQEFKRYSFKFTDYSGKADEMKLTGRPFRISAQMVMEPEMMGKLLGQQTTLKLDDDLPF